MSDVHGHGTTLTVGGTTVGEIFNISGPDKTRQTVDTTSFDSTGSTREHTPLRFSDSGEVTLDLKYNADAATNASQILRGVYKDNENVEFVMTLSNAETLTFDGHITALGHSIPLDDKVTQSVSVKLTGKVVCA